MGTKPVYGWFGAGWASFKEGTVANNHVPTNEYNVLSEWLNGFFAAFADYPDDEGNAGDLARRLHAGRASRGCPFANRTFNIY